MRWLPIALLLAGCSGSAYFEAPGEPPDTSDCEQAERTFTGTVAWTPFPMPFSGSRKVKLWTRKPDGWDEFTGQLYLLDARWDVDWIRYLRMNIQPYASIAVWDGREWLVESAFDLRSVLIVEGDYLTVEPQFTARGTKPKGDPEVSVTVTMAVCGHGSEGIE